MQTNFKRLAIAALVVGLAGTAAAEDLRGAGSTLVAPLIEAWGVAHGDQGPAIDYEAVGSGEGIRRFTAGDVDFGATERPIDDAAVGGIEGGALHLPVTASMVAVAYNIPGFDSPLRLGRETLVGIFAGRITSWDDPAILADNPGSALPARDIALVTRRDASGTSFAFTNHLAAVDPAFAQTGPGASLLPAWPAAAMTAPGNEGVAGRIAISEYSIGYVEHGFARRLGIPVAEIENAAGNFVAPGPEAGAAALAAAAAQMPADGRQQVPDPADATAYPIVTYAWVLLRQETGDATTAAGLKDFFGWAIGGEGQAIAATEGYVPLPPPVQERAAAMIGTLR